VGAMVGAWSFLLAAGARYVLHRWLGFASPPLMAGDMRMLLGARYLLAETISILPTSMLVGLGVTFLLFLLRVALRQEWLAAAVFIAAFTIPTLSMSEHPAMAVPVAAVLWAAIVFVLVRFG